VGSSGSFAGGHADMSWNSFMLEGSLSKSTPDFLTISIATCAILYPTFYGNHKYKPLPQDRSESISPQNMLARNSQSTYFSFKRSSVLAIFQAVRSGGNHVRSRSTD
jgi:hypothetical protein